MTSLQAAVIDYNQMIAETDGDFTCVARNRFDVTSASVIAAAKYHISGTHITTTYSDGSSGRKEVTWHPGEQRFIDWGNNYWLYGPNSSMGRRAGDKWVLGARHGNEVIVAAILDRAKLHSKHHQNVQRMWRFYWELLLMDVLRYSEDAIVDLHLQPLDVDSLAPNPEFIRRRERDRILV